MTSPPTVNPLLDLAGDFVRSLKLAGKSPATQKLYGLAVRQLLEFSNITDAQDLTRKLVEKWIIDQQERNISDGTVRLRFYGVSEFAKFLVDEGELATNPLINPQTGKMMQPPKVAKKQLDIISDDYIAKLLKACMVKKPTEASAPELFRSRRDELIIRLLLDTGLRNGELCSIRLDKINRDEQRIYIIGKGNKPRSVHYSDKTALALGRYLRLRAKHTYASRPELLIGLRGPLIPPSIRDMISSRAEQVGIPYVHPHAFRHRWAHTFLQNGGQEGDLMVNAGWASRTMVDHYAASRREERAFQAAKKLAIGDRY